MKSIYQKVIIGLFIGAIVGNIAIFISSMKLSTEIHGFEQKTFTLKQENAQLEKEMADTESFLHTEIFKKNWGFIRASQPVYIGELKYALNTKR
jgi:hypothetical protein